MHLRARGLGDNIRFSHFDKFTSYFYIEVVGFQNNRLVERVIINDTSIECIKNSQLSSQVRTITEKQSHTHTQNLQKYFLATEVASGSHQIQICNNKNSLY